MGFLIASAMISACICAVPRFTVGGPRDAFCQGFSVQARHSNATAETTAAMAHIRFHATYLLMTTRCSSTLC